MKEINSLSFLNERESFSAFVNDLIQREVSLFFPLRSEYPLDEEFTRAASMYSYLLFDAYFKNEPTLQEVGLFLDEGRDAGELYQDSLYWYSRWAGEDLSVLSLSFCELINKLVLAKALMKKKTSWLLLPDFRPLRRAIERKLIGDPELKKTVGPGFIPVF